MLKKFFFFALALAALCARAVQAGSLSSVPVKDRLVVIVSLDGVASFYLNDHKSDLPTLRRLAAEGAVAENMVASLPTMTWPNHTTLITGVSPSRHGVMGNNYWDRKEDKRYTLIADPVFNKEEILRAPTLYDLAHDAGLKTAGICWPATRGAKTLDWAVPDVHPDSLFQKYSTPSLLPEFRAAGIPYEKQETFCNTDKGRDRDIMYTQMLLHLFKEHRPNLALLHLVEVDHAEHKTGPRSAEAYAAVHFEDERLKEIVSVLERDFAGRATLFVVSDHGFVGVRQKLQPNVKLREAGLLKSSGGKLADRRVFAMDQGGSSYIYVFDNEHRKELVQQVAKMFEGATGIDQVILPRDYKKWGLATPEQDNRMPDLILTAQEGYAFSEKMDGNKFITETLEQQIGAHGHSPLIPDMGATFIAWGAGIKKGVKLGEISNLDVAPTAAALLDLKIKGVQGHVLKSILVK